jgi:hypothetical protein
MTRWSWAAGAVLAAVAFGCQGEARDDATITREVTQDLRSEPQLAGAGVEVRTDQGHVTLLGNVASEDARARAEDLAEDVEGVTSVSNRIAVVPTGTSPAPDVGAPPPAREDPMRAPDADPMPGDDVPGGTPPPG